MADPKLCSVSECGKPVVGRGLCYNHRRRLRLYGDPLGGRTPEGASLKFIYDVAVGYDREECLWWPYGKNHGYGTLNVDGKKLGAHRLVCELVYGPPPADRPVAAHACGNGHLGCVNPLHLRWASAAENSADMVRHGTRQFGVQINTNKLEPRAVLNIRRRLAAGESGYALAKEFSVSKKLVYQIRHGKVWRSLP